MKVVSWNVNGLRSVSRKGFLDFVTAEDPDIICLQEIKIQEAQILPELLPGNYFHIFNFAKKAGYSGVAIFSKKKPERVAFKLGDERFDSEGRLLIAKFPSFELINIYMPHGGRQKQNLAYKLEIYKLLKELLANRKNSDVVIVGDFNIAHNDIDLARPKQNRKNIMFTDEERSQLDILSGLGYVDTFREHNNQGSCYTWWPYLANARERNIGWRIDYCFVSAELSKSIKSAFILKSVFGSDHCPIGIEL